MKTTYYNNNNNNNNNNNIDLKWSVHYKRMLYQLSF